MPGFILHLTAGKMLLDDAKDSKVISTKEDENMFLIGCIIPDATDRKRFSHFRNKQQSGKIMQVPDLNLFRDKYGDRIDEPFYLGYFFHLYIDLRFFMEYLPDVVTFYDEEGNVAEYIKTGKNVRLNKSGKIISVDDYRSDKYYYGDYTRMNTYLINRYNIPMDIFDNIIPCEMEEINPACFKGFVEKMKSYFIVAEDEVNNLEVFDIDKILKCIEKWTKEFAHEYLD